MPEQYTADSLFQEIVGSQEEERQKDTADSLFQEVMSSAPTQQPAAEIQPTPQQPQKEATLPTPPAVNIPVGTKLSPEQIMAVEAGPNLAKLAREQQVESAMRPDIEQMEPWLRPFAEKVNKEQNIRNMQFVMSELERQKNKKSVIRETPGGTFVSGVTRDVKGFPKVAAGVFARGTAESVTFIDKLSRLGAQLLHGIAGEGKFLPPKMTPEEETAAYGIIQDVSDWGNKIIEDTQMNPVAKGVAAGIGEALPTIATLAPFMRGAAALTRLSPAMRSAVGFATHGALKGLAESDVRAAVKGAISGGTLGPLLTIAKSIKPKYLQMLAEGLGFASAESAAELIVDGKLPQVEDATSAALIGMILNVYGQQRTSAKRQQIENIINERAVRGIVESERALKEQAEWERDINREIPQRIDEVLRQDAQARVDEVRPQSIELVPPEKARPMTEEEAYRQAVATKGIKKPAEKRKFELEDTEPEVLVAHGDVSGEEATTGRRHDAVVKNFKINTKTGEITRLGVKTDAELKDGEGIYERLYDGTVNSVNIKGKQLMSPEQMAKILDREFGPARRPQEGFGVLDAGEIKSEDMRVKQDILGLKTEDELLAAERHGEQPFGLTEAVRRAIEEGFEPASRGYVRWVNSGEDLRRTSRYLKKMGIEIDEKSDPYVIMTAARGVGGKAMAFLSDGIYRDGKKVSDGFARILDADYRASKYTYGRHLETLDNVLKYTRVLEDLQREVEVGRETKKIATERQTSEARKWMEEFRANDPEEYNRMVNETLPKIYNFQKEVLRELVDSGVLSQKQFDKIIELNPHYVPFSRILAGEPVSYHVFDGNGKLVETFKSAESINPEALEPGWSAVERYDDGSTLVLYGDESATFSNSYFAEKLNEKFGKTRRKSGMLRKPNTSAKASAFIGKTVKRIKGGRQEIESPTSTIVGKTQQALREAAMNKTRLAITDLAPFFQRTMWRKLDTTKAIRISAEEINKKLGDRSVTQKGITIFRPRDIPLGETDVLVYREGKPEVWHVSENIKDALELITPKTSGAIINLLRATTRLLRTGATATPDFAFSNAFRDSFGAQIQTKVGMVPLLDPARALLDVAGKTDTYWDFMRNGGGYVALAELNHAAQRSMLKAMRSPAGKTALTRALRSGGGTILHPIMALEKISSALEMATRVAVYKRALSQGFTKDQARIITRESTVDFNRMGTWGAEANRYIAFLNAGIQGTDRMARAFRADPIGMTLKAFASVTLPTTALFMLNKDNPEYWEQPRWIRDNFYLFPNPSGNGFIRLPMPFMYGQLFGALPLRVMEYAHTKDPEAFNDLGNTLIGGLSPVVLENIGGIIPTAIKPAIEASTNTNFFTKLPIVSPHKRDVMEKYKYNRYTPDVLKFIGEKLGVSPARIEHLIRGHFATLGKYAIEGGNFVYKHVFGDGAGRPSDTSRVPLIGRFVTRGGEQIAATQDLFYRSYADIAKLRDDARRRGYNRPGDRKIEQAYDTFSHVRDRIYDLTREEDKIIASSLSDKAKRSRLDEIARMKRELMKRAIQQHKAGPKVLPDILAVTGG